MSPALRVALFAVGGTCLLAGVGAPIIGFGGPVTAPGTIRASDRLTRTFRRAAR